jgi:hypothetical protein
MACTELPTFDATFISDPKSNQFGGRALKLDERKVSDLIVFHEFPFVDVTRIGALSSRRLQEDGDKLGTVDDVPIG